MKPKTMILMVVAIGCGLAASYMTSRLLADRNKSDQPANTVKVLVAIKKVPAFEQIKEPEKFFIEKEVPEGTYPAKCMKSFDDIRNQRLAKNKSEEETVFKDDILSQNQAGIYQNLPEGQRAVAIPVNPVSLVGGFVLPGCRVDLIGTSVGNNGEVIADTIMQNMLVLAVDMKTDRGDTNSMLGSTVTFACTLEESMRLAVANKALDIRLVLRSPADREKQSLPVAKLSDIHKPLTETRREEGGAGDSNDSVSVALAARNKKPVVEELTALPQKDEEDPQPVQVVQVQPTPAPAKEPTVFTMKVTNGPNTTKAQFVQLANGEWGSTKDADASDDSSGSKVPQSVKVLNEDKGK